MNTHRQSATGALAAARSEPRAPRTIAVDLTPVLPGGENGGAKVFVLELLRLLPLLAPHIRFVLLTQAASHDELAVLDRSNVTRVQVLGCSSGVARTPDFLRATAGRVLPLIPARLRRMASGLGYRIQRHRKRASGESIVRQIGADLLFCPFTAPTFAEPGVPVVCTLYDLQYATYPQFFAPEDVAHRDAVFRATCREATRIAAISDYARNTALHHGALEPGRIRTIYLRLSTRFEPPAGSLQSTVLERFGLLEGRYLLYPANFWRHKNHEMLLAAFGIAAHGELPGDTKLVCTGAPGVRLDFLRQAACALGLGQRVVFPGYVSNEELAVLLTASAGMVFPSLYEGFGLPVLEAMASGVPVACSNTTSLPEVAAGAAVLFDPRVVAAMADALVTLVRDMPLRERLARAGRERAREFADPERMAREYLELFDLASSECRRVSSVSGVHADGWAGAECRVEVVGPDAVLELDLLAPDWIPHPRITLEAVPDRGGKRQRLQLQRGERASWSVRVEAGLWRLRIAPHFVPAQCGHGEDSRELTLMMQRCALRHDDDRLELMWETQGT